MKYDVAINNTYPINKNRQELGRVVPLSTPFVLYLEPTRLCNLKCSFCSNPKIPSYRRVSLSLELFRKLLRDLMAFPEKVKVLSINGVGEPLCHKEICEFIRLARSSERFEKIRLITNGVLLTPELNSELIAAGLDMLWISIEAMSTEAYREIAGFVDFARLVENIRDFSEKRNNCRVYIKIVDAGLKNEDDERMFYDTFGPLCDNILVEHISNIYYDVQSAGKQINRFTGAPLEYYDICDYVFKGISVNADGTCSPCPVDWKGELLLGDLNEKSLQEIWNSKAYCEIKERMLKGNISTIHACKDCCLYLNAKSSIEDIISLTKHREDILKRITVMRNSGC